MASRVVLPEQPRGKVQQKRGQVERRSRTALGDIGNLVAFPPKEGKPQNKINNRPVTRSFCAQLVANAQDAAEKNKKRGEQVPDLGLVAAANEAGAGRAANAAAGQKKVVADDKHQQKPVAAASKASAAAPERNNNNNNNNTAKAGSKKKGPTLTGVLTARSKEACGIITKRPKELVIDIDEASANDELAVVEYVEDIYTFYKLTEDESRVHDYMGMQPDINEKMRSILVDWLIEVHSKFELRPETLYLTVNIIDRFLAMKMVPRKELQLVGIGSMLLASKYEEIWAPEVNDFVCISDNAYVREQVLAMEKAILCKLEWELTVPTPYMFLSRYIKASVPSDGELENMVCFFAELGIVHYSTIVSYCPSLIAAASVYAARCTLNKCPTWTETLKHYTGYDEQQLDGCARLLVGFHSKAPENKLGAVYKKFSKPDMGAVSLVNPAKCLLAR